MVACETGACCAELCSLRVADNESAPAELPATTTENREDARLTLRAATAQALAALVEGRAPLEHASVPYEDASGRVGDFHSLRGLAATQALAAGASPKGAQKLFRHSSPGMTLDPTRAWVQARSGPRSRP